MSEPLQPDAGPQGGVNAGPGPDSAGSDAPVADPELAALASMDPEDHDATAPSAGTHADAPPPPEAPSQPPMAPPPAAPAPPPVAPVAPVPASAAPVAARRPARRRRGLLYYSRRLVTLFFGILEVLLLLRILLLFLNANGTNEIVDWILSVTQPFVDPFVGMFHVDNIQGANGSIVDVAAIVALIAWILIETLILTVLRLFDRDR